MSKARVFIDGENFLHKIEEVLEAEKINKHKVDLTRINLRSLIESALGKTTPEKITFYSAKLHFHEESASKSSELISSQRSLKSNLEKQDIEFVIAGHVRGQWVDKKMVFREKGVDVKIAVDLITCACDKVISSAVLCSSDSDLQPAVKESKNRGLQMTYLGFAINPNKGLITTTNRSILFRNEEILRSLGIKNKSNA